MLPVCTDRQRPSVAGRLVTGAGLPLPPLSRAPASRPDRTRGRHTASLCSSLSCWELSFPKLVSKIRQTLGPFPQLGRDTLVTSYFLPSLEVVTCCTALIQDTIDDLQFLGTPRGTE